MVQDADSTSNVIPLSNVDGKTMTKVIQYWKKYSEEELVGVLLAASSFDDKQLKEEIIQ
ncbi:hypothetical protein MTR67_007920 [Solanum verrucosum]|uniref:SKP1 component POZ domain-containing protein n=1 Tax=Solanum verrucosum TaxID=315347 RepID=A0AAF0Q486_SOLVR|nr:hypothetical protein MTR67_007920 [Solanum verrucosum]